jgi:hypothetical protein
MAGRWRGGAGRPLDFVFCVLKWVNAKNPTTEIAMPTPPSKLMGTPNKIEVTIMANNRRKQFNAA